MSLRPDQLGKPLKIAKRIQETADAVTLVLDIPTDLSAKFRYGAGQFVTFFLEIGGEAINRSYSLSSSPLVDRDFRVTIKKVPNGRASTYLCERVREGDVLMTAPPAGQFFRASTHAKGAHYYLFAAGSGITPVFSIMKTVLTQSSLNRVTLVYGNRCEDSVIYRRELDEWAKAHPARLDVVHVLSKPGDEWTGFQGRINRPLIAEILEMPGPVLDREYYLCGPTDFMQVVKNSLTELAVPVDLIRSEDFAISLHGKHHVDVDAGWTFIGDDSTPEPPERIIAEINGETVEVAAKMGLSVLEILLEAGAQPPYSCMDGSCMACLAKIKSGRVYQEDPGILAEDNIAAGETLTCQAKCLSKTIHLTYDEL